MKRWNIRQKIRLLLWHFVLCQLRKLWNENGLDTEVNNVWNESVIDRWIWMIPKKSRRQSIVRIVALYSYQSAADSMQHLTLRSETTKCRDEMSLDRVVTLNALSLYVDVSRAYTLREFYCHFFLRLGFWFVWMDWPTARNLCLCWKMKRQQHAAAAIRINYFNRSYWTSLLVSVSVLHRMKILTHTHSHRLEKQEKRDNEYFAHGEACFCWFFFFRFFFFWHFGSVFVYIGIHVVDARFMQRKQNTWPTVSYFVGSKFSHSSRF